MIQDLGIIMITAGITSLLCKLLRQPVVLGYIVAGLLVGPYVCGASWISDIDTVSMWGQVGVTFLLFSMGLEFSVKKLVAMGRTVLVSCTCILTGMMVAGMLTGWFMGWSAVNCLFLGGMLCMSSTTIVFKALDDMGLRQQKFAGICFGILVFEDLFAVVLMVVLASLAIEKSFNGGEVISQLIRLAGYLLLWFVLGILLIPSLLRWMRRRLTDETLTIVSLGLCLGMVLLAEAAGFSAALGAFVMGSILSETVEAEHIESLMAPIKNMFGAVFFVSVGMMINPVLLQKYWVPIVVITGVVLFGQILFGTLGVVLGGQKLKTAMQTSFALTQVGEFAFIIANFGMYKGLTGEFLYPVIVAVSVITTFLTPYTIRLASPAYNFVSHRLPALWMDWINHHAASRGNHVHQHGWFVTLLGRVLSYLSIHTGFDRNLNARDRMLEGQRAVHRDFERQLSIYDLHIADFRLPINSRYCGQLLRNVNWRQETGLTVVRIVRGNVNLNIPRGDERLYPNDRIVVVGTDEQIAVFKFLLDHNQTDADEEERARQMLNRPSSIKLAHFCVRRHMPFCGLTLAQSAIGQKSGCAVIGIDYGDDCLACPRTNSVLSDGAMVVLAGEKNKLRSYLNSIADDTYIY